MMMHMVAALNNALKLAMNKYPEVVVLGEDVGVNGGVFRVTDGLINEFGEERVANTPLAEAGIIGSAIGLAINGMRPVAEIQFSGFMYQAFHHIKQHMARFRQRSEGTYSLPMVVRAPSTGGIRALEHHSESPEAFYVHCQGLKVVMPSSPHDAKGLLLSAIESPDPVIFLEPKKIYRAFKEDVPEEYYTVPIGKAKVVKEGNDATIISWGAMVRASLEAAEAASNQGMSIGVVDVRSMWPLDSETIMGEVKKTGRAIIVHEAPKTGGFGAEIAARIQEELLLHLKAPVTRVAGFDVPFPQFALEKYYLPNHARIMNAIKKALEY